MKKIIVLASALLISASVFAQNSQSAFFLENYVFGYRTNAAYTPEKSFVALPGVGNINLNAGSKLGISSILYPTDQGLVTGFNPAISSEVFLKNIKKNNGLNVNVNENLLAIGFRGKKIYSTIELNVRADVMASLPYELFALLKDNGDPSYDLSRLKASGAAYVELAYGFQKSLLDGKLDIGGRVKALVGAASVSLDVDSAIIGSDRDHLFANADAAIYGACNFLSVGTQTDEDGNKTDLIDFGAIEMANKFNPSGYGAAVDLGVIFRPLDFIEVNVSVNDLGGIAWNSNIVGRMNGDVSFEGARLFDTSADSDAGTELNGALESLQTLAQFHYNPNEKVTNFKMLPFSANAGVEVRMPFYKNLTFAALSTYKCANGVSYHDTRLGASVTPAKCFSVTANVGESSFGPVWGAGMSLNAGPINLFIAGDGYMGKLGKFKSDKSSFVYPVNKFNYSMNFGLAIIFGERHRSF